MAPLKGKRLTTFCAALALLHPLLSLTHWIFRSLMLPYKSSSHSAKCVRCAPLRSEGAADWRPGPRWSILSMLCPVHPFPLRGTSPRWEACHWIRGSRGSPMNPVPLPPQGETRDMRDKQRVIYFMYHSGIPPFGGWRHHLPPAERWDYGCLAMEPCLCRKA